MQRLLLEHYGHEVLASLDTLARARLLYPSSASALAALTATSAFARLNARLRLVRVDVDEKQPDDIVYVHTVYGPLRCADTGEYLSGDFDNSS